MRRRIKPKLPEKIEKGLVGGKMTRIKRAYFRLFWPYVGGFLFNGMGRYKKIQRLADFRPGQRIVEISSGAVPYYMRFRKPVGHKGMVVASDYHLEVVRDARRIERGIEKVEQRLGINHKPSKHVVFDSRKLPFKDASVDRVVASYVYQLDIGEIARVLVPGGKAILLSPWIMSARHEEDIAHYLNKNNNMTVTRGRLFHLQLPDFFTPFKVDWIILEKK